LSLHSFSFFLADGASLTPSLVVIGRPAENFRKRAAPDCRAPENFPFEV